MLRLEADRLKSDENRGGIPTTEQIRELRDILRQVIDGEKLPVGPASWLAMTVQTEVLDWILGEPQEGSLNFPSYLAYLREEIQSHIAAKPAGPEPVFLAPQKMTVN